MSHPHGCVSWNNYNMINKIAEYVTPSRVCELKFITPFYMAYHK